MRWWSPVMQAIRELIVDDAEEDEGSGTIDTPCLTFSGGAFLYPWQLGVAKYAAEAFDMTEAICAAHSAGFAAALTASAGVPVEVHKGALEDARAAFAQRWLGPFFYSTRNWMSHYLGALKPYESDLLRSAQSGRVVLGYTEASVEFLRPWKLGFLRHARHARFSSLKELVYVVTLSQRIPPFYRGPGRSPTSNRPAIDGAISAKFTLPVGQDRSRCVPPDNQCRLEVASVPPITGSPSVLVRGAGCAGYRRSKTTVT